MNKDKKRDELAQSYEEHEGIRTISRTAFKDGWNECAKEYENELRIAKADIKDQLKPGTIKAQEYWLDLCATLHGDPCDFVSVGKPHEDPASTNIHVIEYSAYADKCDVTAQRDRFASRICELEAKYNEAFEILKIYDEKKKTLEQKLHLAIEALEYINIKLTTLPGVCQDLAAQTLEKIKGE